MRLAPPAPAQRLAAALAAGLLLAGCRDTSPSAPGALPPLLTALSPAGASPLASPLEIRLTGSGLESADVAGPPSLYLEVLERTDRQIRLRAGFRGGPPGPLWIRVQSPSGRDSLAFTVAPLPAGDSLTETRALWVSRFEYASAQDLRTIMTRAGDAGFNLVYLQVRGRADAFYRSAWEPWAANLTGTLGKDPGWDPLGVAVEEGRSRGLSVHAWINAFTGWAGSTPPPTSVPLHAFLEHPDWAMVRSDGTVMPYVSNDSRWLTPGHPGVRTRLAAVAADIVRKYPVGGIHLDFIRYPATDYSYDAPSLAAWDSAKAKEPGLGFDEMRRRLVTRAVSEVRDSMRAAAPGTQLSAAVWGIFQNTRGWSGVSTGYESIFQDARAWDRQGLVDALAPMVYWTITPKYGDRLDFAWLADEHAAAVATPVFVGMYVPGMDGQSLARHVERSRMAGAEGVSVFSYSSLNDGGLWGALKGWAFHWPARRVR
ncbi:MAG: family 10 glycosylhydrolase [Longimicrobiales bacterium]|nr:family 10 glycosylhydrolase [Longimicrobiales bacterium]